MLMWKGIKTDSLENYLVHQQPLLTFQSFISRSFYLSLKNGSMLFKDLKMYASQRIGCVSVFTGRLRNNVV